MPRPKAKEEPTEERMDMDTSPAPEPVEDPTICKECSGDGLLPFGKFCFTCNGTGRV